MTILSVTRLSHHRSSYLVKRRSQPVCEIRFTHHEIRVLGSVALRPHVTVSLPLSRMSTRTTRKVYLTRHASVKAPYKKIADCEW
jgi:hypothetical protein